jgi:fatty-acyl-CoA synthase
MLRTADLQADAFVRERLQSCGSPLAAVEAGARVGTHSAVGDVKDLRELYVETVDYEQLLRQIAQATTALRRIGLRDGEAIAIMLPLCAAYLVAALAAMNAAIAFPMNPLLSADAIEAQLTLARVRIVITSSADPALHSRIVASVERAGCVEYVVDVADQEFCGRHRRWSDVLGSGQLTVSVTPQPDRPVLLLHTGGSTGAPKLAQLTERNVAAGMWMAAAGAGWRPGDRLLTGLPLFHVGGLIDLALAGLAAGATVLFPGPSGFRDPRVVGCIWQIAERTGATILAGVPTSLAAILSVPLASANLQALRGFITGGSMVSTELARKLERHAGKPVYQIYGMTEAAGVITAQQTTGELGNINVGHIVPQIQATIGSADEPPRPGLRGELQVRGPNVIQGYRTAAGMMPATENGWLRTGDLAEMHESGELKLFGRCKDVIIRSGHNIDPYAIEDAALRHPRVRDAGAVGMPDAYAGEVPVLFVALHPGAHLSEAELLEFTSDGAGDAAARPKKVFVRPDLPLTPFGKIARFRLRQAAIEICVNEVLREHGAPATSVRCVDADAREVDIVVAQPVSSDAPLLAALRALDISARFEVRQS